MPARVRTSDLTYVASLWLSRMQGALDTEGQGHLHSLWGCDTDFQLEASSCSRARVPFCHRRLTGDVSPAAGLGVVSLQSRSDAEGLHAQHHAHHQHLKPPSHFPLPSTCCVEISYNNVFIFSLNRSSLQLSQQRQNKIRAARGCLGQGGPDVRWLFPASHR